MEALCPHTALAPDLQCMEDEIAELTAHIEAATCRLLELLHEFDRRGGWAGDGLRSCAHWLNWRCGIGLNAAREKLRVAHALAELPKITERFRRGELSYSKVRAVTRVATPATEAHFLHVARSGTASHVERLVRYYRQVKRIEANQHEEARRQAREFAWHVDSDGCFVFLGRLPPEQGALVEQALNAAFDALDGEQGNAFLANPHEDDSPEGRIPHSARHADALERLAQSYLAGERGTRSGGDRCTVHLHTRRETLEADGAGARSELEGCGCVSAETSRRMSCDAGVVEHRNDADGEALNVGRRTRTVPLRSGAPSSAGTGSAAASPAAPAPATWTRTTSTTGPTAARRAWRTSPCSAATTIVSCMKAASASRATRTASSPSPAPTAPASRRPASDLTAETSAP